MNEGITNLHEKRQRVTAKTTRRINCCEVLAHTDTHTQKKGVFINVSTLNT